MKPFDPADMLSPAQRRAAQVVLSQMQTGGLSSGALIDPEWLIEDGNIRQFMMYYFPRTFYMWEPINDYFFDWVENHVRGMIWLPGQHGKTSMTKGWFVYLMCRCPQISIGYTEKNEPTAYRRGLALMQELMLNKRLLAHYGSFKPTNSLLPWSMGAFTIRQRKESGDSPTFSAYGAGGGSILGWRFNVLVNDDPVTAENSESATERKSLLDWFNQAAKTCPSPMPVERMEYAVKHFLIGTVFRLDDLYHSVKDGGEYPLLHLKAVIDEEDGLTLSDRFAYQDPVELAKKAEESEYYQKLYDDITNERVKNLYAFRWGTEGGSIAYFRRYQNEPVDPDAQEFKDVFFIGGDLPNGESYPGCFDKERSYGDFDSSWVITHGCDPNAGKRTKASARFAVVTLGADVEIPNVWYLLGLEYGKLKQQSVDPNARTQMSILVGAIDHFGGIGYIEDNACQAGLLDAAKLQANRMKVNIRVRPHHTGSNKNDPFVGVESLVPMFESGHVRIPYATESDKKKSREMMNEFVLMGVYPYVDIVMGFWIAGYQLRNRLKMAKTRSKQLSDDDIAAYRNRLHDYDIPKSWPPERVRAFKAQLAGVSIDELEEALQ
jgi:hypothetical protein